MHGPGVSGRVSCWVEAALAALALGCPTGCDRHAAQGDPASPVPTFEPTLVPQYLPDRWALLRQADVRVYVEDTLFVDGGWQPQTIWSSYLVTWRYAGNGDIIQREQACELVPGPIYIDTLVDTRVMVTVVPDVVYDHIPVAEWRARVSFPDEPGAPPTYELFPGEAGAQYWVLGATLEDPVHDSCPHDPDDPAEFDQDLDGNPGVTVESWVNGELEAHCYICSRTLYRFEPGAISFDNGVHQITGAMTDVLIDQTRYGSDSEDFDGDDPLTEWNPDGESWYWLVGLDDDATCEDVKQVFDLGTAW